MRLFLLDMHNKEHWVAVLAEGPGLKPQPRQNTNIKKQSFNCRDFSVLHEKLSCIITPESVSLLNCEIYQRGRVSRAADTDTH